MSAKLTHWFEASIPISHFTGVISDRVIVETTTFCKLDNIYNQNFQLSETVPFSNLESSGDGT
jgi:hypothetical protein